MRCINTENVSILIVYVSSTDHLLHKFVSTLMHSIFIQSLLECFAWQQHLVKVTGPVISSLFVSWSCGWPRFCLLLVRQTVRHLVEQNISCCRRWFRFKRTMTNSFLIKNVGIATRL